MAARTRRKHQVHDRIAGYPVRDDEGSFVVTGGITDTTAVAVTLEKLLGEDR